MSQIYIILFNLFSSFVCKMRQAIHKVQFLSTKKNIPVISVVVFLVKKMPDLQVLLVLDRQVFILWVIF